MDYSTFHVGRLRLRPFTYYDIFSTARIRGNRMWKYATKDTCNEFLLSLNLFKCEDDNKYIKILYTIANNKENNYTLVKIKKRDGRLRTIYAPMGILKEIQYNILHNLLEDRMVSPYAKAYYKGCRLKDNSIPHINKKIVLKLDIEDFFGSIQFMEVYNSCFGNDLFPKNIGMLLTYLCTYNDYLPQGAITSPYISNLVMRNFDMKVGTWCQDKGISYTRYSDDMTFSGDFVVGEIIAYVRKQLGRMKLRLNDKKTRVVFRNQCQKVTGIVVNDKVNVCKEYRNKIRQEMYYILKYGINDHLARINIKDKQRYLRGLLGRINYVIQVDTDNKEFIKYRENIIRIS